MEAATKKKAKRGCLIVLVLLLVGGYWFYGPLIRAGLGYAVRKKENEKRTNYEGSSIDNLKALRTALLGYEESEGQFPEGSGWMDAIQNRLSTSDLKKGEGLKKLVHPEYLGQPNKYGYGFNAALAVKYRGDIKDGKTIMVFEATPTEKNAHGDPAKLRRPTGLAITLDGEILRK